MKEKLLNIVDSIFSVFIIIAILGGGIVFAMFVTAIIFGGDIGANISISVQKTVMPYFIKSAAIAIAAGLASFYISGSHELSLEEEKQPAIAVRTTNLTIDK